MSEPRDNMQTVRFTIDMPPDPKMVTAEAVANYVVAVQAEAAEMRAKIATLERRSAEAEAECDEWKERAETGAGWPYEWQVATALKQERDEARSRSAELEAALEYAEDIARGVGEHVYGIALDGIPEDHPMHGDAGFLTKMKEYGRVIGEGIAEAIAKRRAALAPAATQPTSSGERSGVEGHATRGELKERDGVGTGTREHPGAEQNQRSAPAAVEATKKAGATPASSPAQTTPETDARAIERLTVDLEVIRSRASLALHYLDERKMWEAEQVATQTPSDTELNRDQVLAADALSLRLSRLKFGERATQPPPDPETP